MIKTKLTALTLAGLMAVASGAVFAESTTGNETPINKNATKLPGTNTQPMDRTSSETPGAQNESKEAAAERSMKHDKGAHGTHDKSKVTEKTKTN
ncbi:MULTISPECIES: hypothetical protein [Pseudomonas syringae group]|uniref:MarB family protein n=4 Tax=Pseudomonas syringae group TaxID=136849 RepID=A0AA40TW85_9PSED|nr:MULTISPECIES: hypothetical protein [Pseudomonas syringae group]KGS14401.1 hypothetical protein OA77_11305 [Pseudomonas coronafaciens]KOP53909.1 hypothetical protein OX90_21030 [Pseudomonas coronafaciens pv. porri]KOP58217.1 hypothetical protein OX88_02095 [Pseudomonas coronafaciens pv. porri]KPB49947.1 Uncharacterized protein AC511_2353 [Pseudomonas coronafaciens pv. oryzae]KPW34934.1 Uncharacterized protein ALO66_04177 [Pseudomonas coronafaciens pv. atropurpurea]